MSKATIRDIQDFALIISACLVEIEFRYPCPIKEEVGNFSKLKLFLKGSNHAKLEVVVDNPPTRGASLLLPL